MRHLLQLLAIILITSSCKNIEKMVDRGNYDQAINYAVSKLEGEQTKKTKYVQALEKAYARINAEDTDQIAYLLSTSNINRYDKVYDIYNRLEARQRSVVRLHPLVSKDGYVAEFIIVDYIPKLQATANLASDAHYNEAVRLLDRAFQTDKYAARTAYDRLKYIERYHSNYKDTDDLYLTAHTIGTDHIQVNIDVQDKGFGSSVVFDLLNTLDISQLNRFWTQYHINKPTDIMYDYTATLVVEQIDPGFEKQHSRTFEEYTDIEDGQIPVKDLDGNTVTDTLGNIIYQKAYRRVKATIFETINEKYAVLNGRTTIVDRRTNTIVQSIPLNITHIFEDYSSTYQGDSRALSSATKKRLKPYAGPFPTDFDMVTSLAANFKESAYSILEKSYR